MNCTLCPKLEGEDYYASECCGSVSVRDVVFTYSSYLKKNRVSESGLKVKWQHFEHVTAGEKRRLQLVSKLTPPGEMSDYFKSLLMTFSSHLRRAKWQNEQKKLLIENLPANQVCCVHDYSENYTCQHQDQLQSLYYTMVKPKPQSTSLSSNNTQ